MQRSGGFSFDMGPTWYLMPEVFEEFFTLFGRPRDDLYRSATLDPSYRVFFWKGAARLQTCLADARHKYEIALKNFLYRVNTLAEIIMYASVAALAVALFMITRSGPEPCPARSCPQAG